MEPNLYRAEGSNRAQSADTRFSSVNERRKPGANLIYDEAGNALDESGVPYLQVEYTSLIAEHNPGGSGARATQ